jgi:hypothetical protein
VGAGVGETVVSGEIGAACGLSGAGAEAVGEGGALGAGCAGGSAGFFEHPAVIARTAARAKIDPRIRLLLKCSAATIRA